ncbi:hypothetical protein IMG5_135980 [Ichthyophthirius multifiliis]|uniref:Uncharacterized protein n=1 Tax=Ichthyophthirius multifiliis TaxID=5932 RepID=G0QWX2_ICHMU|nr:hypothetical protein IMG5_135980 [Ichthyophthirius multifiliis]EGR30284.1 hypothetical protein IMG5_135980 [Ichthyophthirius multifiliis]|eukprot:XP_004031871.1 hypothetical protein IMG5_135980 [Ichthyophthirius multifiliis]
MKYILQIILFLIITITQARKYYQILGVSPNATEDQIKKAYRKLSIQHHPDKSDDPKATEKYQQINVAYEVLKDRDMRRIYDAQGEEGVLKYQGSKSNGMEEQKGKDANIKIPVTLEDIYNGSEIKVNYQKQQICSHCRGSGAFSFEDMKTCNVCDGKGFTIEKQQVAPGYYQQYQMQCNKCQGRGTIVFKQCNVCGGQKTVLSQEEMSFEIEKGIDEKQQIKFDGQADEYIDKKSSDLIFYILQVPHSHFQRKKNDLYLTITLTMEEALLGFKKKIQHLDSHYVKIEKIGVTQPKDVMRVEGEGMPVHLQGLSFGDLYVEFAVQFPRQNTQKQLEILNKFFSL